MDYSTSIPVWCQLVLLILLSLERVLFYLFSLLSKKRNSICQFNSCCGVFSGKAQLSDRVVEEVSEKEEEEEISPLAISEPQEIISEADQ